MKKVLNKGMQGRLDLEVRGIRATQVRSTILIITCSTNPGFPAGSLLCIRILTLHRY
jgi:hypothetical protein